MRLAAMNNIKIQPVELSIVPALAEHVGLLKKNLRPDDAQEILRFGVSIDRALWRSFKGSLIRKTAFIDGEIAAMWGVTGVYMGKQGCPWLMTTPVVQKISPLKFTRIYQKEVDAMFNLFPVLANYVDSAYASAIRLLEIIKFEIGQPEPIGAHKELYRKFEKKA